MRLHATTNEVMVTDDKRRTLGFKLNKEVMTIQITDHELVSSVVLTEHEYWKLFDALYEQHWRDKRDD